MGVKMKQRLNAMPGKRGSQELQVIAATLEADMIAYSVAPFLDELQQRRAAMAMIETLTRPGTVVAFERRGLE
jgi:hypothetical protein